MDRVWSNREEVSRWLPRVRETRLVRAKYALREVDYRPGTRSDELLSLSKEHGVVSRSEFGEPEGRADSLLGYKLVLPGQIVMNKMQAWNGVFGLSARRGLVSPDYSVFEVLPGWDGRFLAYSLRSAFFVGQFGWRSRGMGTAFLRLHPENLLDTPLIAPSLEGQVLIANYIDAAAARHGATVAALLRSMDLDRERVDRLMVDIIEQPVSRAPVRRLRSLACLTTDTRDYGPRPVVALEHVQALTGRIAGEDERPRPDAGFVAAQAGDVLFGKLRPYLRKVVYLTTPAYVSTEMLCLRPNPGIDQGWLSFVLRSPGVVRIAVSSSDGTKMPRTSWEDLGEARVPVPSLTEQRRAAGRLRSAMSRHLALADAIREQIRLLRERDVALTNAGVTGEIVIPWVGV